jgi:uncharacterized membrane protein YphA (DoxX/SURF4 family)
MTIVQSALSWLPDVLGVVMVGAGIVNFIGPASVREAFARWGYPSGFHRITGALEIAAGLLLILPATVQLGAIATAIILIGAIGTLIRSRDWSHLPGAFVLAAVATTIIFNAYVALHGASGG